MGATCTCMTGTLGVGKGGHSPHDWLCTRVHKKHQKTCVFFRHKALTYFFKVAASSFKPEIRLRTN